jgi:hypothetical protein
VAQEGVDRPRLVAGPVRGDDRLQRGGDLGGAGDAARSRFEQRHRRHALGRIDRQLERDQGTVGVTHDVGPVPADVVDEPGADRCVVGDGERAVSAAVGGAQTPPVAQRGQSRQPLDQRYIPRDEGTGVHQHHGRTAIAHLVGQFDVIELQALHVTPPRRSATYEL